jgi:glycosyltransferase 2 family protein
VTARAADPGEHPGDAGSPMPGRRRIKLMARLAFAATLLAVLLAFIDLEQLLAELLRCAPFAVVAAAAFILAGRLVVAWRWLLLVRSTHAEVSFGTLARLTLMGTSLSFLSPGMVATEAYRIAGLAPSTGVGTAVASVVVERLTSLAGLALVFAVSLAIGGLPMPEVVRLALLAGCVALFLGCILTMAPAFRRLVDVLIGWLPTGMAKKLGGMLRAVRTYAAQPVLLGQMFVMSLLLQLCRIAAWLALAWGLGVEAGLGAVLIVIAAGMAVTVLPLTPQGLGTREVTFVALLGSVGVAAEQALAFSLLYTGITAVVVVLPALWFYIRYGVWGRAQLSPTGK